MSKNEIRVIMHLKGEDYEQCFTFDDRPMEDWPEWAEKFLLIMAKSLKRCVKECTEIKPF